MVRETTAFTQFEMDKNLGTEPLVVLKIEWTAGSVYYSTKDVSLLGAEGRILSYSGISSSLKTNNVGIITTAGFTLSDYDGALKDLFDNTILEGTPCEVSLGYDGGGLSDLMLLFKGKVSAPISWSEGNRSLSLDAVSLYKDKLVGNLISSDKLQGLDFDDAIFVKESETKMKPMSFGTPLQVKAIPITRIPVGSMLVNITTGKRFKYIDLQVGFQFDVEGGEGFPQSADGFSNITIRIGEIPGFGDYIAEVEGSFVGNRFTVSLVQPINPKIQTLITGNKIRNPNPKENIFIEPQTLVYLRKIDNNEMRQIYLINDIDHMDTIPDFEIREVKGGWVNPDVKSNSESIIDIPTDWYTTGLSNTTSLPNSSVNITFPLDAGLYIAFDFPISARQFWYNHGVLNLLFPFMGQRFLGLKIPSFYNDDVFVSLKVKVKDQTDKQVLEFPNILTPQIAGTGPLIKIGTTNPIEAIDYLITNWSNLTLDTTNLGQLKLDLDKYENHFTLTEQIDVLDLVESISFRNRVGVNNDGANLKLVYLSKETKEVISIDEKEIKSKTINLKSVSIVNLKTRLIGSWRGIQSNSKGIVFLKSRKEVESKQAEEGKLGAIEHRETYSENEFFGIQELDINFFNYSFGTPFQYKTNRNAFSELIQNSNIRKSIEFWGHRLSNVWRLVEIINFQNTMKLEIFDIIKFESTFTPVNVNGIPGGGLSSISKLLKTSSKGIKGIVISMNQDTSNDTVSLVVMLESQQGQIDSGIGVKDKDFWFNDSNDPLTQGPPVAR